MKNKAYKNTSVNYAKSQTAVVKLLNSRGIYESRFTNLTDRFALEFRVVENGIERPLAVRIVIPIQYKGEDEKNRTQEINALHRVLFYHLKSKFVAIDAGVTEFMEEFMSHLVIMDKNGTSSTMGQVLLPQYKKAVESGEQKEFKLLDDGKKL